VLGDEGLHAGLFNASGLPTSTSRARAQPSFDKQFVRDYCEKPRLGQDRARAPSSPRDVVAGTRAPRYVEAFRAANNRDRIRRLPRQP